MQTHFFQQTCQHSDVLVVHYHSSMQLGHLPAPWYAQRLSPLYSLHLQGWRAEVPASSTASGFQAQLRNQWQLILLG